MPYVKNRPQMARRAGRPIHASYVRSADYRGPGAIAAFDLGAVEATPATRTVVPKKGTSTQGGATKTGVVIRTPTPGKVPSAVTAGVQSGVPQPPGCDPVNGWYLSNAGATAGQCVNTTGSNLQSVATKNCGSGYTWDANQQLCVVDAATAAAIARATNAAAAAAALSACAAGGGTYDVATGICTPPTAAQVQAQWEAAQATAIAANATAEAAAGGSANAQAMSACTGSGGTYDLASGICTPRRPTCQTGFVVDPSTNQCVAVQCQAGFVVDASSGNCIPIQPTPDIACAAAGGTWDAINNICVKQTSATPPPTTGGGGGGVPQFMNCVDGYYWDPVSGQCVVQGEATVGPGFTAAPPVPVPDASTGFSLSSIPWWAWLVGAAGAYMLLVKKPGAPVAL